jgi:hypothetical protein
MQVAICDLVNGCPFEMGVARRQVLCLQISAAFCVGFSFARGCSLILKRINASAAAGAMKLTRKIKYED